MGGWREVVDEFCAGRWVDALSMKDESCGLCKRGSLALLVHLEDAEVEADLHCLSGYGHDPLHGHFHYVLKVGDTCIDVSARQFDEEAAFPRIETFASIAHEYLSDRNVDFENSWDMKWIDGIPSNWRDLREVGPPGEIDGWPYDP